MQQIGRYQIVSELGNGAMGTVYRAIDPRINRTLALKTINTAALNPFQQSEFQSRFFREAEAAGRLHHPNIVTIYDADQDPDSRVAYIAMEFVEGEDLAAILRREKTLPIPRALAFTRQLAQGLDYAHDQGVVHRDVKPANVLVTPDDTVKLTDFGVAHLGNSELTRTGQMIGSPSFMSPEQVQGQTVDGRSDLFGLGVVLYRMLAGTLPFDADHVSAITHRIVHVDPAEISQVTGHGRPDLDLVVRKLLAKRPADRYQSGAELVTDLDALARGQAPPEATAAPPPAPRPDQTIPDAGTGVGTLDLEEDPPTLTGPSPPGPRSVTTLAAAAVVILAAAFAIFMLVRGEPDPSGVDDPAGATPGTTEVPPAGDPRPPDSTSSPAPARTATLELRLRHRFKSGTVTLDLDQGRARRSRPFSREGDGRRRWTGRRSETVLEWPVAAGKHEITVIVEAGEGQHRLTGSITGTLAAGQRRVLTAKTEKSKGRVALTWTEADPRP